MNLFVVTGAPGVGKTALISELSKSFLTECEPARQVIAQQRACNGTGLWDLDRQLFIHQLLQKSKHAFLKNRHQRIVFFDRGIPDTAAYALAGDISPTVFLHASRESRYNRKVFLLPPWQEIYTTDEERDMSFSQVEKFHRLVEKVYLSLGYELIEVPRTTVKSRVQFLVYHCLAGDWSLQAYSRFDAAGKEIKWDGNQSGRLTYSSDGQVNLRIHRTSTKENLNALDKARLNVWYQGRFRFEAPDKIHHIIESASIPSRVGNALERIFTIKGNLLEIEGIGLKGRVKLTWKRTKKTDIII